MARNTSSILLGSAIAVAFSLYLAAPGTDKPIFKDAGIQYGLDLQGGAELLFSPRWESVEDPKRREELRTQPGTLTRIAEITRKRIDVFGLKEIDVRVTEGGRIRVELPGQDQAEAERIKNLIVTAGRLEFRLVAEEKVKGNWKHPEAPPGYKWLPYRAVEGATAQHDLLQVEDKYDVTGEAIADAQVGPGKFGGLQVNFQIRRPKQRDMGALTGENLGRHMAIVLDGVIQSAPVLRSEITDSGMIEAGGTGGFAPQEANDLVTVLKTGSLPVAMKADSQNVVGPGLGRDAIEAGTVACLVGTAGVVLLTCLYYLGPGVIAVLGLGASMALMVGVLAAFNATLTLSGIAGLVLTLGMAVDANVLIYERIREERGRGLGIVEATTGGFDRATETILDSNITTLLTALILYLVGEGPVQGFAITLSAGIVASMVVSLVTTRAMFVWLAERGVLRNLRMNDWVGQPSFRYTSGLAACLVASGLCIVGGVGLVVYRGVDNLGLDFRSGTLVQFALRAPTPIAEVRAILAAAEVTAADGTTWRPYATAGIKSVYRSWADATGDAREFQVRVGEELQAAGEGKDVAQIVRADIEKLFAGKLAPDGFGEPTTVPEGVGWSQTYRVRLPTPFDDLKRAVEKALTEVFGEAHGCTVARLAEEEKETDVRQVVVTSARRPLPEGQSRADLQKRLSDDLAKAVHERLDEDGIAVPLPDEIVVASDVTERVAHRLPVAFRAPVPEAALREVLRSDGAGYTESEVLIEVAEPDKVAPPADAPTQGPLVRAATFVRPGQDPAGTALADLQRHLRDGFATAGVLLADPFPQMTSILPSVARELRQKGILALLLSLGVILVYMAVRFRAGTVAVAADVGGLLGLFRDLIYRARFGIAAIAALAHNVLVTLGAVALVDHLGWIDAKVDLPMIAAFLTLVGYSLNDTIVVFDRIRENLRKGAGLPMRELIDLSVNQTLARTVITGSTTLVTVSALLVFGPDSTRGFAFTMLVGILVGTYSSIFIASPLLLLWEQRVAPAPSAAARAV